MTKYDALWIAPIFLISMNLKYINILLTQGPGGGDSPDERSGQGHGGADVGPRHREEDCGQGQHRQPGAKAAVHLHIEISTL